MWILSCEGDALNGKKLWLRPGKKFLFGRTQAEEGQFVVSDKTISRKHMTVEVASMTAADCANPRVRSRITLTDLETKIGTFINGEEVRNRSYVLDRVENTIGLGRYKHKFKIIWVPITFTFSFNSKDEKADPYSALYELLGPLDIKVLAEYEREWVTHVVAKNRNTSKGLQALINGKYIAHNDSFIKAIIAATTPDASGKAPLEQDFEANFPDPVEYLPPKGREPTEREASSYRPDPSRQDMFAGYTFVFYERRQFNNLLKPITEGAGKALLREVVVDETTVDDFVRYVKGVAGEKGLGEFEDGSEGKGVVVVRYNPVKGPGTEWYAEFGRSVALHLDHRLIEQNEFLDAILGNDASVLRRPLEVEPSGIVAPPPTAATIRESQAAQTSPAAPDPTPAPDIEIAPPDSNRRGRSRRGAKPAFKPFDDDFSGPTVLTSVPESMEVDCPRPEDTQPSQSLFVSQDPEVDMVRETSQPRESSGRAGRKRRATPIMDEDMSERMAPTALSFKKQRLEKEADRKMRGEPTPQPEPTSVPVVKEESKSTRGKKVKREDELMEAARQTRERAEALAQEEREALLEKLGDVPVESMSKLVIIKTVEVKRSQPPPRAVGEADEGDRWDDHWNGRKNFKRFRRRGADSANVRPYNRVIVPLTEVKKKDFGIGDDYWDNDDSQRRHKRDKVKSRDTQEVSQIESQGRSRSRAADRAAEILARDGEEDSFVLGSSELEDVFVQPKATSSKSRSQKLADKTNETQNLPTQGSKRTAAAPLTKPAPAKKARQTTIRKPASDEDSDDDLKFKFKGKKRA